MDAFCHGCSDMIFLQRLCITTQVSFLCRLRRQGKRGERGHLALRPGDCVPRHPLLKGRERGHLALRLGHTIPRMATASPGTPFWVATALLFCSYITEGSGTGKVVLPQINTPGLPFTLRA